MLSSFYEEFRKTRNHGIEHIFMGSPLSDGCDKTTVEVGNQFSPGVWSCGISVWIYTKERLYCPDKMELSKIEWNLEHGNMPVLRSVYQAGAVHVENRLVNLGDEGSGGVDFCILNLSGDREENIEVYIVVKDMGPAGGKIQTITWNGEESQLMINGSIELRPESPPDRVEILNADADYDSPMAVLLYDVTLNPEKGEEIRFRVIHAFKNTPFGEQLPVIRQYHNISFSEAFQMAHEKWENAFPAKLFCGDSRLAVAWENSIYHILSAMELGLPRIGAVNYPVFWIRDCVIVLRALDLIGRHDLAHIGNGYLSSLYFGGGFGAESDAPGEGIWSLTGHALLTGNIGWLKSIFPDILKRVTVLDNMLSAKKPLRALCENRKPDIVNTPGGSILCLASQNGLIHGRMDHHSPDFYINIWSVCGYRMAAKAAMQLEREDYARTWNSQAENLERRIFHYLLKEYGNPRDLIVAPYPCSISDQYLPALKAAFIQCYCQTRMNPMREAVPEKEWTYFEIAQIHNAMLLGFGEEAWICLDSFLERVQGDPVAAFTEGAVNGEERLPFKNDTGCRGWLSDQAIAGNMPHNWTTAETVTLIRDMFVLEKDGCIFLGQGITESWLRYAGFFKIENFPTELGTVHFSAEIQENQRISVHYDGPSPYKLCMKADIFNGKNISKSEKHCQISEG